MTSPSGSPVAVVVLAAGSGTRMKSATPKMLHPVAGRTMLAHALHAAAGLRPTQVVAVVGHCADQVRAAIEQEQPLLTQRYGGPAVATAFQAEQKGTGHAVTCALESDALAHFGGTIVVTTSDVPLLDTATLEALIASHEVKPAAGVTILTTTVEDPHGYGRIVRTADGEVTAIVEEKDADDDIRAITEVNSGVYAFDAALLRHAITQLDTNNAQGEFYLTDVITIARSADKLVRAHRIDDAATVAGVNDRVQLAAATSEFYSRTRIRHMLGGVTMINPESVFIDVDVELGSDIVIEPNVQLRGGTSIGDDCRIGPDTLLDNVTVGAGSQVVRTHGFDSTIGAGANVGPFTYIRPGTVLGEDGKLGGFVETKKATIGRGTKVPHLTYVGDATIGDYTNIGASSVFVNYDGVNKHHTTVGSHVRTGSDTMFIAPVTIGDGAYSGAGTVIKDDVPPGALTVSGSKQRIIEGWVAKNRPGTPSAEAAHAAIHDNQPATTNDDERA